MKSLVNRADFTLSLASCMEFWASPTMLKDGNPLVRVLSTVVVSASKFTNVAQ